MSDYSRQIAMAARLLKAKGQVMVLVRMLVQNYDPLNPYPNSPIVGGRSATVGVVLPASQGTIEAFDNRILGDPEQRRSFRFVILAAANLTFEPRAEDLLLTAEGPYRLLGATPLNVNGVQPILYNLGCTLDTQIDARELSDTIGLTVDGGPLPLPTEEPYVPEAETILDGGTLV